MTHRLSRARLARFGVAVGVLLPAILATTAASAQPQRTALFEALYLRTEYLPFAPGALGRVEGFLAWLFVLGLLLYRRPPDRRLGAVEATLAAQALLSFVHALTLPSTMARGWWGTFEAGAVLRTVWTNFPPAFWLGCSGLLLVALPVYLRRTSAGEDLG